MNSIPWWAFLVVAGVGLLLTLLGKNNKKQGMAFLGTLLQLVGAVLTLLSFNNVFRPSAHKATGNAWTAEAYGVAKVINENFSGKKVVVMGWISAPGDSASNGNDKSGKLLQEYMDTLAQNGVDAKYVSIAPMPPVGVPMQGILELIEEAWDKVGDAEIIVYRDLRLYAEQIDIVGDYKVIQTTAAQDQTLWDEGIIVAAIKMTPGANPENFPSDVKEAFEGYFDCEVNPNRN